MQLNSLIRFCNARSISKLNNVCTKSIAPPGECVTVSGTDRAGNRAIQYRMKTYLLLVVFTFFVLWRIEEGKTRNPTAAWIPVSTYTDLAQCQQKSTGLNKNKTAQHPRRYVCLPDTIQPPAPT